jgi:hypothetical protein
VSADPQAPLPLPDLLAHLEALGWSCKLSSRLVRGVRRYSASVWREGERTDAPKYRAATPSAALAGAWQATETAYRRGRVWPAPPRPNKQDP